MKYNGAEGLIVLDKPKGLSCREIDIMLSREFGTKVGHCGTLDPMVSGVLPILVGKWTRLEGVFQQKDKEYVGVMMLHSDVPDDILRKEVSEFVGEIIQTPPRRSAVSRRPRKRVVHSIEILERRGRHCLVRFVVQAGTYIRKLIHDIGKGIGGAHMADLRRTRSGEICEDIAVDIDKVLSGDFEFLHPPDYLGLERWVVRNADRIRKGTPIFKDSIIEGSALREGELVSLYDEDGMFIGVGKVKNSGKILATPDIIIS